MKKNTRKYGEDPVMDFLDAKPGRDISVALKRLNGDYDDDDYDIDFNVESD